jgi:hypothetical protein
MVVLLEIFGVDDELVNASWRVGEDRDNGTRFMKTWWTHYECLTTRAIERVARPEFLKLKFKHFVVKLDNVRELGNVLFVFPDARIRCRRSQLESVATNVVVWNNDSVFLSERAMSTLADPCTSWVHTYPLLARALHRAAPYLTLPSPQPLSMAIYHCLDTIIYRWHDNRL